MKKKMGEWGDVYCKRIWPAKSYLSRKGNEPYLLNQSASFQITVSGKDGPMKADQQSSNQIDTPENPFSVSVKGPSQPRVCSLFLVLSS